MATKTNSGFTIIETMLYLGVSSALIVAILFGVGSTINQQRYRDSVDSLKLVLQEQYSAVANTVNNRSNDGACGLQLNQIKISNSGSLPGIGSSVRGSSECMIIGRYIESVAASDGMQLNISDVIAYPTPADPTRSITSDIDDLDLNYYLTRGTAERARYELPWSTRIVDEGSTSNAKVFSMMIVRSPRSGGMMTFSAPGSSSGTPISAKGLVSPTSNKRTLQLCVDGDQGFGVNSKLRQVRVMPYGTSASAVQIPLVEDSVCG